MENPSVVPAEAPAPSSFMERAVDIFSSPGKVYGEVAALPVQTSSWVIPYILTLLIAVISNIAIFSNPTLQSQALEPQKQAIQERVQQGRMTQEQANQAEEMITSGGTMMLVIGIVGAVVVMTIFVFAGALVFWLAAKLIFKSSVKYKKMLEVYGLPMLIGVLGGIVTLLMMHLFSTIYANPGGGLIVMDHFNRKDVVHMILTQLNVFSIWQMAVLGVGISKVSGKSTGSGVGLALGFWGLWVVAMSLVGNIFG